MPRMMPGRPDTCHCGLTLRLRSDSSGRAFSCPECPTSDSDYCGCPCRQCCASTHTTAECLSSALATAYSSEEDGEEEEEDGEEYVDYGDEEDYCGHCDTYGHSDSDCPEPASRLRPCSYRPSLNFHGGAGDMSQTFYGMEVEVTDDGGGQDIGMSDISAEVAYFKEDGSVDGFEMCTHPMTYRWAMDHFPWHVLRKMRYDGGSRIIPDTNGIHVHVNRAGFDSPAHQYRWIKMVYRNEEHMVHHARRDPSEWGGFKNSMHSALSRVHPDELDESASGEAFKAITMYGGDSSYGPDRYSAVNVSNTATFEVRIFASTLRPERAKATLQTVAALVEYTRAANMETGYEFSRVTVNGVAHSPKKSANYEWSTFIKWAIESGEYAEFIDQEEGR